MSRKRVSVFPPFGRWWSIKRRTRVVGTACIILAYFTEVILCSITFWPTSKVSIKTTLSSRYRIRGIRNIIFYDLPHYPVFYQEILNFMDTASDKSQSAASVASTTCTCLYTKFSSHRLAGLVGTKRCSHMMSSAKDVHMFVTGSTWPWRTPLRHGLDWADAFFHPLECETSSRYNANQNSLVNSTTIQLLHRSLGVYSGKSHWKHLTPMPFESSPFLQRCSVHPNFQWTGISCCIIFSLS